MSLPQGSRGWLTGALVLLASLIALVWYAQAQAVYSLAFLYQVARAIFPELAAIQGGP